jgi:hypothetical protein
VKTAVILEALSINITYSYSHLILPILKIIPSHQSYHVGTLTGHYLILLNYMAEKYKKEADKKTSSAGFEPARASPADF